MQSQKNKVKNRIEEVGFVDNFWAIHNYILRLGAIIHELRNEGMKFTGAFGKELGKERANWKNYYYTNVVRLGDCIYGGCGNSRTEESPLCNGHLNRPRL